MKHALRALALAAAVAAPAALSAQTADKPVTFGVSGGLSLPLGDFGENLNGGFNVTGHVFFKPASLQSIRLRGDVSYDRWDYDNVNANFRALGLSGNAIYDFPTASSSIMKPYVLGGLGIYNGRNSRLDDGDSNLGLQVGGGLTFQLSGFSTFAEAKLVNVLTDGQSTRYFPVTFGVRF